MEVIYSSSLQDFVSRDEMTRQAGTKEANMQQKTRVCNQQQSKNVAYSWNIFSSYSELRIFFQTKPLAIVLKRDLQ